MNETEHTCSDARPWHLPPIEGKDIKVGCPCCSTARRVAPMEMVIAVGFGMAFATKDDVVVYEERADMDFDDCMTVGELEALASQAPEHDWRITKVGPLHGETLQRQGPGQWICIESNMGFA